MYRYSLYNITRNPNPITYPVIEVHKWAKCLTMWSGQPVGTLLYVEVDWEPMETRQPESNKSTQIKQIKPNQTNQTNQPKSILNQKRLMIKIKLTLKEKHRYLSGGRIKS